MATVGRLPGPFLHDPNVDDKPAVWSLNGLLARLTSAFALWEEEYFSAATGETVFVLLHTTNEVVAGSMTVHRSGVLERGWTFSLVFGTGFAVTLNTALSAEDDLVVRYQYTP